MRTRRACERNTREDLKSSSYLHGKFFNFYVGEVSERVSEDEALSFFVVVVDRDNEARGKKFYAENETFQALFL